MKIIIDTSVWIEFLRAKGDPTLKARVSNLIIQGNAAYTCPVGFELILGAKPHELKDLRTALSMAVRVGATPDDWDEASEVAAKLRRKGMNLPTLDILIASVASVRKMPVLARDGHFAAIREIALPALRLV